MKLSSHRNYVTPAIIAVICMLGVAAMVIVAGSRWNATRTTTSSSPSVSKPPFPMVNSNSLSPGQGEVLRIVKEEYEAQPEGTKYSEGTDEPWCADFVSWVFKQANRPLVNPNSGSWRIPGTYTLREYYETARRFKPANSAYTPQVGDIMLYDRPSPFGQHANIVIKNDNGVVTTIGGNEPGGIRVFTHNKSDKTGFIGYGVF